MTGTCRLCCKEKELRYSHIIPEFMYQNIYDNPQRFNTLIVDLDKPEMSKNKIEQKGIREYLLCGDCEVQLSKYEKYAAETIYAKNHRNRAYIKDVKETTDQQYFIYNYEGFSYSDFKIFLLSLLWRLIISKSFMTPEIDNVIIEQLRVAIYNQDPMDSDDFGCLIQMILYKKGEIASSFILDPYITNNDKSVVLNILIDGFMYSFFLNSKETTSSTKDLFLKKDGTMVIIGRVLFQDKELFERIKSGFEVFYEKRK